MFRQLIAAWRKTDHLKEMYGGLLGMLEMSEWMFFKAWEAAVTNFVDSALKEEVYKRDIEINRAERDIRKRIIEHLSVQPDVDLPACLVLMSVVKDAERIGDYCKNILEIGNLEAAPIAEYEHFESFTQTFNEIHGMFSKTRKALCDSDEILSHEVIYEERHIGKLCDSLIERIAKSDLPAGKAVPWALLARYLKRVSAHLGNLATSIVMPLHKLDYFDETLLKTSESTRRKRKQS